MISWDICLIKHIRKVEPDFEKANSLVKMSEIRLNTIHKLTLDDENSSIFATDYYEVIKEILIAIMLKRGLKSNNHECIISFFKNNFPSYEYEANIIYQLKEVRNRISYDGFSVKKEYIQRNLLEFENIIGMLKEIAEQNFFN